MSDHMFGKVISCSLRTGAAFLPLAIAMAQTPVSAQTSAPGAATKSAADTKAKLEAEAAKARAEADAAADDDAQKIIESGAATNKKEARDIVVVGSSIRGVAATGSNVVSLNKEEIQATGATSVSELFSTIPQLTTGVLTTTNVSGGSFNNISVINGGQTGAAFGGGTNIVRTGMRQNEGEAGGTNTLILVDGARTSNIGSQQQGPQTDTVPVALLERVELNLDGASSVYGSDASGGVINMVTRRRFDGIQVNGKVGYGDDYTTWDTSIIAGHSWGKLSILGSYGYAGNDMIFTGERSFYKEIDWNTGLQRGTSCDTPNVTFGSGSTVRFYPVVNTGTGSIGTGFTTVTASTVLAGNGTTVVAQATATSNLCTLASRQSLQSANARHNALASLAYDITDEIKFLVRGRYSQNRTTGRNSPATFSFTVSPNNPWYRTTPTAEQTVAVPAPVQTVIGNFSPVFDQKTRDFFNGSKQWGVFSELTANLDGNFQLKVTGTWDESRTNSRQPNFAAASLNNGRDTGTATSTNCAGAVAQIAALGGPNNPAAAAAVADAKTKCINPYNLSLTNPAIFASITNSESVRRGKDRIYNAKAVVDGTLGQIPGGRIKIAVGGEYYKERFTNGFYDNVPGTVLVFRAPASSRYYSAFAELNVPLVSSANAMSWVREFRISASGRYDNYKQSGGTFNPRVGATFKPLSWISFRGTFSTSFRAPGALDILNMRPENQVVRFNSITGSFLVPALTQQAGVPLPVSPPQTTYVLTQGVSSGLQPQTSAAWSVGIDLTPVQGLRASLNYYHTQYKNNFANPLAAALQFPQLAVFQPNITQAELNRFLDIVKVNGVQVGSTTGDPTTPITALWALLDGRTANLGKAKVAGTDYSVKYTRRVGFGTVFASINGTVNLTRKRQATPNQLYVSVLTVGSGPRHTATGQFGFTAAENRLRTTVTVTHSDGFNVIRSLTLPQDRVAAFNQFTLFGSYDFPGDAVVTKGLQLSVTIQNLLNTSPPVYKSNTNSGIYGGTLGRIIQVGLQKKF